MSVPSFDNESDKGKAIGKEYITPEPVETVKPAQPIAVSDDPEGQKDFVMPDAHKKKLEDIFEKLAAITGSTSKASWAAVRYMGATCHTHPDYTEVIARKSCVPAGLPMPFGMDELTLEVAYSKTLEEKHLNQNLQELEFKDFMRNIQSYAQIEHINGEDGCHVLEDIEAKYDLLLKYAPLTDKEEERLSGIFHAVDADGDKKITVLELEILSNIPDSPFTQQLLEEQGRCTMTFPAFASYMTHVKQSLPRAWSRGMLDNMEDVLNGNAEAAKRLKSVAVSNTWFRGDAAKWLARNGGWRLRFDGYEEKKLELEEVDTMHQSQAREDELRKTGGGSPVKRESACSCEGCVIC